MRAKEPTEESLVPKSQVTDDIQFLDIFSQKVLEKEGRELRKTNRNIFLN